MSGERFSQLAAELYVEVELQAKNLRENAAQIRKDMDRDKAAMDREFQERFEALRREQEDFEREKQQMLQIPARENDVLSINAGGIPFMMKRSLLTDVFPQSYLARMFSGRWEQSIERDPQVDPQSFDLIVNYLRDKRMETPERPAAVPVVHPDKKESFDNLLNYLGLVGEIPTRASAHAAITAGGAYGGAGAHGGGGTTPSSSSNQYGWGTSIRGHTTPALQYNRGEGGYATPTGANGGGGAGQHQIVEHGRILAQRETVAPGSSRGNGNYNDALGGKVSKTTTDPGTGEEGAGSSSAAESTQPERTTGVSPAAPTTQPATVRKSVPGWSKRYAHPSVSVEEGGICKIPATNDHGSAAAVRATRGFNKSVHAWQIVVQKVSDYSYVGFVDDTWNHFQSCIGKSMGSWGIASNGILYAQRNQTDSPQVTRFYDQSVLEFVVDLDSRACHVTIDGVKHERVFTDLPKTLYPAVSNCRSPAIYKVTF
ncbi:unnamed protein product [Amoebophrya sp. A25]|nr:unnamed protein product [Amoebophrya sp. A25]|eukprot:GSA25T00025486001.1